MNRPLKGFATLGAGLYVLTVKERLSAQLGLTNLKSGPSSWLQGRIVVKMTDCMPFGKILDFFIKIHPLGVDDCFKDSVIFSKVTELD
jgi:hypothetical protein